MRLSVSSVGLAALLSAVTAHCPNFCNGHGRCTGINKCECFGGWEGGDCSLRKCPSGAAWADVASGTDIAHGASVCSNMGLCNTATGRCGCAAGYEGIACNRMICPNDCSKHGECRSMRLNAKRKDLGLQTFGGPYLSYTENWDADMIWGCQCDGSWIGWDCSERACPYGDDPLTTGQQDAIQFLRCDLNPTAYTSNTFTLSFRGYVTAPFPGNADAATIKARLEALPTIGTVTVAYTTGTTFCDNGGSGTPASRNAVSVRFRTEFGDLPRLTLLDAQGRVLSGVLDNNVEIVSSERLADGSVSDGSLTYDNGAGGTATATSQISTKEWLLCSGRGKCDRQLGVCSCYTGFTSSDGLGGAGTRADCGYANLAITACPGATIECSGHGSCTTAGGAYQCQCQAGWAGGDCSERSCPSGPAWFDAPTTTSDVAHATAECSNKGLCDRLTGQCVCQSMFEGDACERMTCPGKTSPLGVCSGHGQCLTMRELAAYNIVNGESVPVTYGEDLANAATWDGSRVRGCLCDAGWTGYDCSLRTCPSGEDVTLREADATLTDEVQTLQCELLDSTGPPTFKLQFRGATTAALPYTATAAQIKAALEALTTIGTITVSLYDPTSPNTPLTAACTSPPGTIIRFDFVTEHGDVPPIRVAMDDATVQLDGTFTAADGFTDTQLRWSGGNPSTAPDYRYSGAAYGYTYLRTVGTYGTTYPASGIRSRELTKGTSIAAECSGRGICTRSDGTCACFDGFGSSDGARGKGNNEDCGYREPFWPIGQ